MLADAARGRRRSYRARRPSPLRPPPTRAAERPPAPLARDRLSAPAVNRACRRAHRPCRRSPCRDYRGRRQPSGSSRRGVATSVFGPFNTVIARYRAASGARSPRDRAARTRRCAPPSSRAASPGCGVNSQARALGGSAASRLSPSASTTSGKSVAHEPSPKPVRPSAIGRAPGRRPRRRPLLENARGLTLNSLTDK